LGTLLAGSLWSWIKLKLFQRKQPKEYMGGPDYVPPTTLPQQSITAKPETVEAPKQIETSPEPEETRIMSRLFKKGHKMLESVFPASVQQPKYITPFESKTRFTMIGPVGAGKTVISALMLVTAETRSQDEPGFYCNVIEYGSQIREAAWMLRSGHFPPKTIPTGQYAYETGLEILRRKFLREQKVHVPLIDVAGEDQQFMLAKYADPKAVRNPVNYLTAKTLLNYLKSSKGLILTLCAPRVPIPGLILDEEPI